LIGRLSRLIMALGLASVAAPAQPPALPASGAAAAAKPCCTIPAETGVEVEITELLTSLHSRTGQLFAIRLVEPIVVDGRILVPAGVTGVGEVVHAARGGTISGSAGELIVAARYLDFAGLHIPLHRTGLARSGTYLRFGPFYSMQGGGTHIAAGTRIHVVVRGDVSVPAPAAP
jgi:hypothetical protein